MNQSLIWPRHHKMKRLRRLAFLRKLRRSQAWPGGTGQCIQGAGREAGPGVGLGVGGA